MNDSGQNVRDLHIAWIGSKLTHNQFPIVTPPDQRNNLPPLPVSINLEI
jgi:hypothetical protein